MRAVIITADGLEHRFVTKYLAETLGDQLSGIVIERQLKLKSPVELFKKVVHRYGVFTIIERVITKIVRKLLRAEHRKYEALNKVVGQISLESFLPPGLPILEVESANKNECVKWLEGIRPDYIFVYGTGIIGKRVLSLALQEVLNLHTGISPFYRGSDCSFWPLYNMQPLMVGSTVHKCTPEIDGGDIYGRVSVRLSENDNPDVAFAKSVKAGAVLYSSVAKRLVSGEAIATERQDFSLGNEYRFKDKTFVHDIYMEYLVSSGKLKQNVHSSMDKSLPYYEPGVSE
jgi:folate-dependent phosphoribosylglycinamide formyltransferase PurN